jgi:mercuric reductase
MIERNLLNITLKVDGMTCSHCNKSVEASLKKINGVAEATADYRKGKAEVKYIEGKIEVEEIIDSFNKDGRYKASLSEAEKKPKKEQAIFTARHNGDFDLIILGGGSAAFAAAIKASELGARVAIAEENVIGGTCLNRGCVPSKFLIKAAELYHMPKRNGYVGVETRQGNVDFAKLIAQKDSLLDEFRQMKYWDVLEAYPDITFFHEKAYFVSKKEVRIGDKNYRAERFIIATGSSPWIPPIEGINQVEYLTSTTALDLKELPKSMIVLGGSAVGLEFAQMYTHFGTKVTTLELMPRILPGEEEEISDALRKYLEEEGIEVYTEARIESASNDGRNKKIMAEIKGERIEFKGEALLVATGRRPNTSGLGLEKVAVELDKKDGVIVNDELRTSASHIWATGDVASGVPMLVTVAARHGSIAAENALTGSHKKIDYFSVPYAVFTTPEVAGVGLGEREAQGKGYRVKVGYLDFKHVPKAAIIGDTRGLMKMIVEEETSRILGVRMVAPDAADIIQKASLFVKHQMTTQDVLDAIDVYPTLSESIKLCAQTFEKDVTKLSCCAD